MRMYNALFALRKIVKRLEFKHKYVCALIASALIAAYLTYRGTLGKDGWS